MNIYDGSVDYQDTFYRDYNISWDEQLNSKKKYYENNGYKVVFVFLANSFQDAARAVLYNLTDRIPQHMRDYKNKYVRINGHWILESRLGICDKCGNYSELTCLCKDGYICESCDSNEW